MRRVLHAPGEPAKAQRATAARCSTPPASRPTPRVAQPGAPQPAHRWEQEPLVSWLRVGDRGHRGSGAGTWQVGPWVTHSGLPAARCPGQVRLHREKRELWSEAAEMRGSPVVLTGTETGALEHVPCDDSLGDQARGGGRPDVGGRAGGGGSFRVQPGGVDGLRGRARRPARLQLRGGGWHVRRWPVALAGRGPPTLATDDSGHSSSRSSEPWESEIGARPPRRGEGPSTTPVDSPAALRLLPVSPQARRPSVYGPRHQMAAVS